MTLLLSLGSMQAVQSALNNRWVGRLGDTSFMKVSFAPAKDKRFPVDLGMPQRQISLTIYCPLLLYFDSWISFESVDSKEVTEAKRQNELALQQRLSSPEQQQQQQQQQSLRRQGSSGISFFDLTAKQQQQPPDDDNSNIDVDDDDDDNDKKLAFIEKCALFYSVPITKFWATTIFYLAFLLLYSYMCTHLPNLDGYVVLLSLSISLSFIHSHVLTHS